jgi:hypothetical protein
VGSHRGADVTKIQAETMAESLAGELEEVARDAAD